MAIDVVISIVMNNRTCTCHVGNVFIPQSEKKLHSRALSSTSHCRRQVLLISVSKKSPARRSFLSCAFMRISTYTYSSFLFQASTRLHHQE